MVEEERLELSPLVRPRLFFPPKLLFVFILVFDNVL